MAPKFGERLAMYWMIMVAVVLGPRGSAPSTAVLHVGTFSTIGQCLNAKTEAISKNEDTTGIVQARWFCIRAEDQKTAQ